MDGISPCGPLLLRRGYLLDGRPQAIQINFFEPAFPTSFTLSLSGGILLPIF